MIQIFKIAMTPILTMTEFHALLVKLHLSFLTMIKRSVLFAIALKNTIPQL